MLESQKLRFQILEEQKVLQELELKIFAIKSKIENMKINLQSSIAEEIARDNNFILVEIYNLGPKMPEKGILKEKRLLKDFEESFQKDLLLKGEIVSCAGINPVSWSGTRWVIAQ